MTTHTRRRQFLAQTGSCAAHLAAAGYAVPASLGEWTVVSKQCIEVAFTAWYRRTRRLGQRHPVDC